MTRYAVTKPRQLSTRSPRLLTRYGLELVRPLRHLCPIWSYNTNRRTHVSCRHHTKPFSPDTVFVRLAILPSDALGQQIPLSASTLYHSVVQLYQIFFHRLQLHPLLEHLQAAIFAFQRPLLAVMHVYSLVVLTCMSREPSENMAQWVD